MATPETSEPAAALPEHPSPRSPTPSRAPAPEGGHDRRRVQGAGPGVPGHLDLEDPLPRGSEAAVPAAYAGRLSALHPVRHPAAADDPPPPARRVPAASGDPPGAGRRPRRARGRAVGRRPGAAPCGRHRPRPRRACTRSRTWSRRPAPIRRWSRELVDFGVIKGEVRGGTRYFDETEREIVRAVSELARYGVGGRNLRVFRSSADREAQLLQSILAPALRSRNPERRKEAIEALENLASVTTHLKPPAADPRPAQDRRHSARRAERRSAQLHPRHPRLPAAGDRVQGHHAAAARAGGARRRRRRARRARGAAVESTWSSPPRPAGSSSAARSRASSAPGSSRRASPASCRTRPLRAEYGLEYGIDSLEVHTDAFAGGARVLVHDDLLATGGTATALVRPGGAARGRRSSGCAFLIELKLPRRPRAARAASGRTR